MTAAKTAAKTAKPATAAKKATKPAAKPTQVQAPAAQAPAAQAPAAPAQAQPQAVALRGGAAVATVKLTGKAYRSAAKHNTDWWALVQAAALRHPAPVATLVKQGVPTHFIGYAIRRGYLAAA